MANNAQNGGMAAPLAPAAPAQHFVMDYRTTKIADLPLFNGDQTDAITAEDFIRKVIAAKDAMRWDNATTAVHFKACLRGKALEWLKSQEFFDIDTNDFENGLKNLFCNYYVKQFKIINTLTNIQHLKLASEEHPRDFQSRVCTIFADIEKAKPELVMPLPPVADRDDAFCLRLMTQSSRNAVLHIMKCVYISGLTPDYVDKIIEKKPATIAEANELASEMFEVKNNKKTEAKINTVETEKFQNDEEWTDEKIEAIRDPEMKEAMMAVQRRRQGYFANSRGQNQQQTRSNYGNQTQAYQPNRNNENRNNERSTGYSAKCWYCKGSGHHQIKCRDRLSRSAPMRDFNGKPMNTPGTREFETWKNELKAKGKTVMIIDSNSENISSTYQTKNY